MENERTILCDIRINDATQLGTDDFAGELDLDGERVMIFHKGLGGYIKTIQEDNDRLNRERLKEVKVLSSEEPIQSSVNMGIVYFAMGLLAGAGIVGFTIGAIS